MRRKNRVSLVLLLGLLIALAGSVPAQGLVAHTKEPSLPPHHAAGSGDTASVEAMAGPSPANLLQFQAGEHIAGFLPDRMYLVSLDHALSVQFVGAVREVQPLAAGAAGTGVPPAAAPLTRVTYTGLWPGIDLTYEGVDGVIAKSTYQVAPGADVGQIQLRYNAPVALQDDGSLRFEIPSRRGMMRESAPLAWQEIGGRQVPVAVSFRISDGNLVGFEVGAYDRRYPLTIDPKYRWHTFYGSGTEEYAYALAVDGSGDVYVAGYSAATWQGPAGQAPLHTHSGSDDLVMLKLAASGAYKWHTFYGSGTTDHARALGVDGSGSVYVAGHSDATWDGPGGQAPLHAHSEGYDLLVLKLDGNGDYRWHTFYGSATSDLGYALAVDGSGSVYVAGHSSATWDGPGGQAPLHAHSEGYDLLVLKLDGNGSYRWHTFCGSADWDLAYALAVDGSSNVYVAGYSEATWDGPAGQAPLHAHSGNSDLAVLRLDGNGAYQWHTFYGSGSTDVARALAVDASGGVYVAGSSGATWNGPAGEAPLHAHSGSQNWVVLKLAASGTYRWHTFYAGGRVDQGSALGVDGSGDVYVAGYSDSTWDGPAGQAPLHAHSGSSDLVVLRLDGNGAYQWHTFYGSGNVDNAYALAVGASGAVYAAGHSNATWQGPGGQAPLHAYSGDFDLVMLKLSEGLVYLPLVLRNHRTWDPYYEENDHWLAAYGPLNFGQAYQAYPDDADDYYYFDLSSDATVNISVESFSPTRSCGQLLLYGPATGSDRGDLIAQYAQPGPEKDMVLPPQSLGPGKYYVRVYASCQHSTSHLYTLTVSH